MSFIQTFIGELRLFVHFQVVVPEGVWVSREGELPRFVDAGHLTRRELDEVAREVIEGLVRRCAR